MECAGICPFGIHRVTVGLRMGKERVTGGYPKQWVWIGYRLRIHWTAIGYPLGNRWVTGGYAPDDCNLNGGILQPKTNSPLLPERGAFLSVPGMAQF